MLLISASPEFPGLNHQRERKQDNYEKQQHKKEKSKVVPVDYRLIFSSSSRWENIKWKNPAFSPSVRRCEVLSKLSWMPRPQCILLTRLPFPLESTGKLIAMFRKFPRLPLLLLAFSETIAQGGCRVRESWWRTACFTLSVSAFLLVFFSSLHVFFFLLSLDQCCHLPRRVYLKVSQNTDLGRFEMLHKYLKKKE